jgi:integrase
LTCSLHTTETGPARFLSRCLYLRSEELFITVESSQTLSDADIAALVKDFYGTILAQDDKHRLLADAPDRFREARAGYYRDLAERARIDLANNAYATVRQITSVMLARRYGADAAFDKLSVRKAGQAMLRAGVEVAETLRARASGDFNYEPNDKLLVAALSEQAPAPETPPAPVTPSASSGPPFSEAAERFRTDQLRRKVWEKQTALQARKTYELFRERFGDKPLAAYDRLDASTFKAMLSDLPADYGKAAQYRGMTAEAIVAATKEQEVERLSSRTIQRHFASLATLWEATIEQRQATTNPFKGWKFPAAKRARDQREHWTREQLAGLLATPLWTGCQSESRRSKPGAVILRDEKYWLPLIALFSGMRQEEICQLRLVDVRTEESVWVFDINSKDGQQLKNANAVRLVPIHDELIRLGVLAHADKLRATSETMLFPNLKPGGADDRLGHNYSKWFSRYRQDVGQFVPGRDFHSFRHSATTFLRRASVDEPTIDELTGHATVGETARYSKGLTVANLSEAINRIDIGVDLSHLHVA